MGACVPRVRHPRAAALAALLLAVLPTPARADDDETDALVTVEGESALREKLARHVLAVTARHQDDPLLDPAFLPATLGHAVRAAYRGRPAVLTSLALVGTATHVAVAATPGADPVAARVGARDEDTGVAVLEGVPDGSPAVPAPATACQAGHLLFFVLPAGGATVLSHTRVVGATDGDPLIVVAGRLPEGLPLFDASGRLAALAIRRVPGQDRAVAAPLCLPPPPDPDAPAVPAAGQGQAQGQGQGQGQGQAQGQAPAPAKVPARPVLPDAR